jgi:uncharacterized protein YlaN (UPF0358 family)
MKQSAVKPVKQDNTATVQIDLNNEVFQTQLFALEKPLRHAALETIAKIKQMSWQQIYQDAGLK